jgi:hypothetical protein
MEGMKIIEVDIKDVRFPTSLRSDGSDAMVKLFNMNKYSSSTNKFIKPIAF